MDLKTIKEELSEYPDIQVNNYLVYINRLATEKNNNNSLKNPWMKYKTPHELIRIFKTVSDDGLVFDGIDITLQSTGVSYSYQAYKNKMFIAYPESLIDVGIVYDGDTFNFAKESGKITYTHNISAPFEHNDNDIIGCYCVIKNARGEFLTTLSRDEIDKHRAVARTDYIWSKWLPEMVLKTVVKKACKQHFKDTYNVIEKLDNENYDLDKPEYITEKQVSQITDMINSIDSISEETFLSWAKLESISKMPVSDFGNAMIALKEKAKATK